MTRRRIRRRGAHRVNHDRWLVSYADFITLLFAFFVVLYASSQVDKRKVGMLALAIQVAFQQMGVFPASTTQVPIDSTNPMPFSVAQAIENTERTASLGRVSSRPQGSPGTGVENGDLADLQTELETELAPEIARKEIAMRREPDGLVISLREFGFFESGSGAHDGDVGSCTGPHRRHARKARLSLAHRGLHRQRPHPYRAISLQLGALHVPRH